jgi:hypothetical protein
VSARIRAWLQAHATAVPAHRVDNVLATVFANGSRWWSGLASLKILDRQDGLPDYVVTAVRSAVRVECGPDKDYHACAPQWEPHGVVDPCPVPAASAAAAAAAAAASPSAAAAAAAAAGVSAAAAGSRAAGRRRPAATPKTQPLGPRPPAGQRRQPAAVSRAGRAPPAAAGQP